MEHSIAHQRGKLTNSACLFISLNQPLISGFFFFNNALLPTNLNLVSNDVYKIRELILRLVQWFCENLATRNNTELKYYQDFYSSSE